jgi:hypothetical protein
MAEETPLTSGPTPEPASEKALINKTSGSKWLRRVPKEILISPGGIILISLAVIIEIIDLIPLPLIDQLWEIPLELIFIAFFLIITKSPWQSTIIPFVIERIPVLSDLLPTWLIKLFI